MAYEICQCPLPNEFFATLIRKCVNCEKHNKQDVEKWEKWIASFNGEALGS